MEKIKTSPAILRAGAAFVVLIIGIAWLVGQRPVQLLPAAGRVAPEMLEITVAAPGVSLPVLESEVAVPLERLLAEHGIYETEVFMQEQGLLLLATSPAMTPGERASLNHQLDTLSDGLQKKFLQITGPALSFPKDLNRNHSYWVIYPGEEQPSASAIDRLLNDLRAAFPRAAFSLPGARSSFVELRYESETLDDAGLSPLELRAYLTPYLQNRQGSLGVDAGGSVLSPVFIAQADDPLEALEAVPVRDPRDGSISQLGDIVEIELKELPSPSLTVIAGDQQGHLLQVKAGTAEEAAVRDYLESLESDLQAELLFSQDVVAREVIVSSAWRMLASFVIAIGLVVLFGFRRLAWLAGVGIVVSAVVASLWLPLTGGSWDLVFVGAITIGFILFADQQVLIAYELTARTSGSLSRLWRPLSGAALTTAVALMPVLVLRGDRLDSISMLGIFLPIALLLSLVIGLVLLPRLVGVSSGGLAGDDDSGRFSASYLRIAKTLSGKGAVAYLVLALIGAAVVALVGRLPAEPDSALMHSRYFVMEYEPGGQDDDASDRIPGLICAMEGAVPAPFSQGFLPAGDRAGLRTLIFESFQSAKDFADGLGDRHSSPYSLRPLSLVPDPRPSVELAVTAPQRDVLEVHRAEIVSAIAETVSDDILWQKAGMREALVVEPDLEEMAENGITPIDLAAGLAAHTIGIPSGSIRLDGLDEVPVFLQAEREDKLSLAVEEAILQPGKGRPIFLEDVAEVDRVDAPSLLSRIDGAPALRFAFTPEASAREHEILAAGREAVADLDETGLQLLAVGRSQLIRDSKAQIIKVLPIFGALFVGVLLVSLPSLRQAIYVMLLLIPTAVGVLTALILTGNALSLMALMGGIAAVGIACNQSLVMLNQLAHTSDGDSALEVFRQRLAPICLTALMTVVTTIPLLYHPDVFWQPFGASLLGGTLVALLSTLILIPMLHKSAAGSSNA